jgi:flagellar export protein FliJ
MRHRKSGLPTLQRLAQHGADAASREVGARLRALRAEEERLQQVKAYLEHYRKLSVSASPGLTLGTVQGRRQFASRLQEAVERQARVVAEQQALYQQQVQRWREARAQALALQRYNERTREHEQERRERRDQANLDEIAQRRR